MPRHYVHDRRIATTRHAVLHDRPAKNILSSASTASKAPAKASAQARRSEAIVAHAHSLSLLGPYFALQLLVGGLQSLVLLRHVVHALLESFNRKFHLIQFKAFLFQGRLVLLNNLLVSFRLQSRPLILILRRGQFRLESPLLVPEVVKLLGNGYLLCMHLLGKLKHVLPGLIIILV